MKKIIPFLSLCSALLFFSSTFVRADMLKENTQPHCRQSPVHVTFGNIKISAFRIPAWSGKVSATGIYDKASPLVVTPSDNTLPLKSCSLYDEFDISTDKKGSILSMEIHVRHTEYQWDYSNENIFLKDNQIMRVESLAYKSDGQVYREVYFIEDITQWKTFE